MGIVKSRSGRERWRSYPARGGSKRIPKKNLAAIGGKSLLAWTIEAAKSAQHVSHALVSTDDAEIAGSRAMGIDVPWLRPESLSADTTSDARRARACLELGCSESDSRA